MSAPSPPVASSSITVTKRADLSLLYRALKTTIRPFRPHLVSPGKPLPAGSPKLEPPKSIPGIKEHKEYDIWHYTYDLPANSRKVTHNLYYFAGGGFQSPPSSEHWKICNEFTKQLAGEGYSITLVSYPLAPNSPAPRSLPMLRNWLKETCATTTTLGKHVTLAGDSAGGNVVLNLGLWWAEEVVRGGIVDNPVKQILAISPATDMRNDNPGIKEADAKDPVLSIGLTTDVGKKWVGDWGIDSPEVSPNLSPSIPRLKDANIKVHGVVGTADVLAPDALMFKDLLVKHGVRGEWLIWENQMHCFPLASVYGLAEGKAGRDWIIDLLRRNAWDGPSTAT